VRIPGNSGLEPQVIKSIKSYRRKGLAIRYTLAGLQLAAVLAALAVFLWKTAQNGHPHATTAQSWVSMIAIAAAFVVIVLLVGPLKIPLTAPGEGQSLDVFRDALQGVSLATGLQPPELLVLDLPTANSLSLYHSRRAAVGITAEALSSESSARYAEPMMAHELAHILLGDVLAGSTRNRWRVIGVALVAAIVLPFVFLALAFGVGTWLYVGLVCWAVVTVAIIQALGKLVSGQDDLLADSLAARITSDPGGLKEAIEELSAAFLKDNRPFAGGARYPSVLFVYEARPGVDLKAIPQMGGSTKERIQNLEAIERGHWQAFPD
jgi:Zn-dependent protease with chaperone function